MRKRQFGQIVLALIGLILAVPGTAHAYIGPGLGLTVLATIGAIFATLVLFVVSIVYFPIKRLMARKKNKREDEGDDLPN